MCFNRLPLKLNVLQALIWLPKCLHLFTKWLVWLSNAMRHSKQLGHWHPLVPEVLAVCSNVYLSFLLLKNLVKSNLQTYRMKNETEKRPRMAHIEKNYHRCRGRSALLLEHGLLVGQLWRLILIGNAAERGLTRLDVGERTHRYPAATRKRMSPARILAIVNFNNGIN